MNEAFTAIDNTIQGVKKLRANLKKKNQPQVRSHIECSLIKATALSWVNNHRKAVVSLLGTDPLNNIDQLYNEIIQACDHSTLRRVYRTRLKNILHELSAIKGNIITVSNQASVATTEEPPDFSSLTTDVQMQTILKDRWEECRRCISGKAPLAATVMMGGFLESLLLAQINKEPDQSRIYKAKRAPKDTKTQKVLQLKDWTLRHYIDVAHELKWISQSAKDVGEVLRDFRNYIHPFKQVSHGITLSDEDASLFWEITKSISRQLLR